MSLTGLISLLLVVALVQGDPTTTTTTEASTTTAAADATVTADKADILAEILASNNIQALLPDNTLSIGFESVGMFLLLAGVIAFLVHLLVGVSEKPAAELYSYPPTPTTYSTGSAPGSGYAAQATASGYTQEEAYNVHRNLEQAAAKYQ